MADFALPGDATRQRGVPAHAEHLDVFRILDEEARGQAGRRTAKRGGRNGLARKQRQAAVVVQEVEAEIGVAEALGEPAQGDAPLAVVACVAVRQARHRVAAGESLQRAQAQVGIAEAGTERRLQAGRGVQLGVADRLRRGAEAKHHVGTARRTEIVRAEIGAGRIDFDLFELEHVQGFDREVVGEAEGAPQHVDRHEGFFQLGAGDAQLRHVDRIDDVDAVLDEGALAPADGLAADAEAALVIADLEVVIDEGIEQAEVGTDLLLRRFGQVVATVVLEVVEVGGAHEGAPVAILQAQLGSDLERIRERVALVVLQVAVVAIDREAARRGVMRSRTGDAAGARATSRARRDQAERDVLEAKGGIELRLADQIGVRIFGADRNAVGNRGVEAAGELPLLEIECLRGRRGEQGEGHGRSQRSTGEQPANKVVGFHCFRSSSGQDSRWERQAQACPPEDDKAKLSGSMASLMDPPPVLTLYSSPY